MVFPVITIVTRHSAACPHRGDETYQRCNCWKHLRWFEDGRLHWKATKERTWAGAERIKQEMIAERNGSASAVEDNHVTVAQAIEVFLVEKTGQNLTDSVIGKYKRELERLRIFLEALGIFTLQDVRLPHLTAFRATWPELYPETLTRSKVQERLKGFFRYATFAYPLPRNPAQGGKSFGLTPIKVETSPTMPLEPKEYTALLAATSKFRSPMQERLHALVQLGRWSGLAIQDAVCLPRVDLRRDAERNGLVVTARVKNGNSVEVPIPADVATELEALPNGNPAYFFWTGRNAETATKSYSKAIKALFKKAGVDCGDSNMRFHRLRDTFAVENLKKRIRMEDVSRMLGHSSIKTTEKHYAQWVQGRQDVLNKSVIASWAEQPAT
jgi:integrase